MAEANTSEFDLTEAELEDFESLQHDIPTDEFDLESLQDNEAPIAPSASKEKKRKKESKLLNKEERNEIVKSVDQGAVVSHVMQKVPNELMPLLFPTRLVFWKSIEQSKELRDFIHKNIDIYLQLYNAHSKGKDKYANLCIDWLKVIASYTCKSQQTDATIADLGALTARHEGTVDVNSTVIASILHAVQDGVQRQMSLSIESLEEGQIMLAVPSDDTSLYRISGWALKSTIDHKKGDIKHGRGNPESLEKEIQLLISLKCSKEEKEKLPIGTQFMDRGGLTYVNPKLLPWVCLVEKSMQEYLNQRGYQKYGKNLFKVTRDNVLYDNTLLSKFSEVLNNLHQGGLDPDRIESIHAMLLHKIL